MAESTREEVKRMVAAGLKPRQIALALRISTQAVYKHLANLRADAAQTDGDAA